MTITQRTCSWCLQKFIIELQDSEHCYVPFCSEKCQKEFNRHLEEQDKIFSDRSVDTNLSRDK